MSTQRQDYLASFEFDPEAGDAKILYVVEGNETDMQMITKAQRYTDMSLSSEAEEFAASTLIKTATGTLRFRNRGTEAFINRMIDGKHDEYEALERLRELDEGTIISILGCPDALENAEVEPFLFAPGFEDGDGTHDIILADGRFIEVKRIGRRGAGIREQHERFDGVIVDTTSALLAKDLRRTVGYLLIDAKTDEMFWLALTPDIEFGLAQNGKYSTVPFSKLRRLS